MRDDHEGRVEWIGDYLSFLIILETACPFNRRHEADFFPEHCHRMFSKMINLKISWLFACNFGDSMPRKFWNISKKPYIDFWHGMCLQPECYWYYSAFSSSSFFNPLFRDQVVFVGWISIRVLISCMINWLLLLVLYFLSLSISRICCIQSQVWCLNFSSMICRLTRSQYSLRLFELEENSDIRGDDYLGRFSNQSSGDMIELWFDGSAENAEHDLSKASILQDGFPMMSKSITSPKQDSGPASTTEVQSVLPQHHHQREQHLRDETAALNRLLQRKLHVEVCKWVMFHILKLVLLFQDRQHSQGCPTCPGYH